MKFIWINFYYMNRLFIIIVLFSNLSGCYLNNTNYKDLIIGEWDLTYMTDGINNISNNNPFNNNSTGLIFEKKGIINFRNGFVKNSDDLRKNKILNFKTNYYLINNLLYVFDLSTNKWINIKIIKINETELILQYEKNEYLKYEKWGSTKNSKSIVYDDLIVSFCGCAGGCPTINIILHKNGSFCFEGETNSEHNNGYYIGQIEEDTKSEIDKLSSRIDISNFKNVYGEDALHQEKINLSFVNDHKVIKTIIIYGDSAPYVINWLLKKFEFISQQTQIMKVISQKYINFTSFYFESNSLKLELTRSESFYLWNLLQNSIFIHENRNSLNYKLKPFINDNLIEIRTDGRVFEIIKNKQKSIFLDIGINFIDENKEILNLVKKD